MATNDWRKLSLDPLIDELAGRLSDRKWRLLACAAIRRLPSMRQGTRESAIQLAERFADGQASAQELAAARFAGRFLPGHPAWAACWDPREASQPMALRALAWVEGIAEGGYHPSRFAPEAEAQANLLREIATDLFRPVVMEPSWLAWNDGLIGRMASGIYLDRTFDQMPILGDALEEAGCLDSEILEHCRQGKEHVRGCWVLDCCVGRR
jgi:hypothetical protein